MLGFSIVIVVSEAVIVDVVVNRGPYSSTRLNVHDHVDDRDHVIFEALSPIRNNLLHFTPMSEMIELAQLKNKLENLKGRLEALRGYL